MDDEQSKLQEAYALTEDGGQTPGPPKGRGLVRARIRVPEELPTPKKINAVILTPEIAHIERGAAVWEIYGTLTSFVYYDSANFDLPDTAAAETAAAGPAETETAEATAAETETAEATAAGEGLADDYFLDLAEAFPEKPMEGFGEAAAVNLLDLEILEGEAWEISPGVQCLKHQVPFCLTLDQLNQGDDQGDDLGEGLGLDQDAESVWESAIDLTPEVEQVECQVLGPRILDLRVEMRLKAPALPQPAFFPEAIEPPEAIEYVLIDHETIEDEGIGHVEFSDESPATFSPEAIEPIEIEPAVVSEELAGPAAELEITTWSERIEEDLGSQALIEEGEAIIEEEGVLIEGEVRTEEGESQGGFKENMTEIQKASGHIESERSPAEQEQYQHEQYQHEQYQYDQYQQEPYQQESYQQEQYQQEPYQQDEPQQGQFAEQYEEIQSVDQYEDLDSKVWEEADFPEAIDLAAVENPADLQEEMAGGAPAEIEAIETEADWPLEAEAEPEAGFDLAADAEAEFELSEAADTEAEFEAEAEIEAEIEVETELFESAAEAADDFAEAAEADFAEFTEAELSDDSPEAAEAGLDELAEADSLSSAWVGIGYKTGSINRRRPGRVERDARLAHKNGEPSDSDKDLSAETGVYSGSGSPRPRSLNQSRSEGLGQSKEDYYPAVNPPIGLPKIASRHSGKRQSSVYRYYLIQPGDDWAKVAANYQLSAAAIKEANPTAPEVLAAGQRLKIPADINQEN